MHVPIETARAARDVARRLAADCCVAVGGGSTIGLGKAIALESAVPIVAVPTTYAGSEMTPIYGLTDGGLKRTGRDRKVLPKTVLYDPTLTVTLPPRMSGPSGMNAIAHCVEALYAPDANPIISLLAAEGIRVLARSLPVVVKEPARPRCSRRCALWRLARGNGAGRDQHEHPPQAVSCAGRRVQSAPRRRAHGHPAARHGVQSRRRARGDARGRRRPWRPRRRPGDLRSRGPALARRSR